ncbi:MAG: hypothetical protein HYY93_12420 [Planctomycetes bacterium]|nr:hypothetical protein [Planctomycetota bacterium]
MPIVLSCACGKRLRVPDERLGQKVRCPGCAALIVVTSRAPSVSDAPAAPRRPATPSERDQLCAICQGAIGAAESLVDCAKCRLPFHAECWDENGGCGTYGCSLAPKTVKAAGSAAPTTGWGDTKTCPACGKEIRSIALKCRHCEATFTGVDPITPAEYREVQTSRQQVGHAQIVALVLFVVSLFGCCAPITLPVAVVWVFRNRQTLRNIAGGHLVIAFAAIAISTFYCLAYLLFVILGV